MVVVLGVSTSSIGSGASPAAGIAVEGRHLAVVGVAAVGADEDDVFAVRREGHELVRGAAPHHPGVGADDDEIEPDPAEDALVGAPVVVVLRIQPRLIAIEACRSPSS